MGERAYAYSKACAIIGKSFTGKRIRNLERAERLSDFDRLIFPASFGNLPEKELLLDLENRIMGRTVNSIISILKCFSKPPEFIINLIRSYEYLDLMNAISAFIENENSGAKKTPAYTNLGQFQTVRFDAWPDIKAMIEGTPYNFLLDNNDKNANNDFKKENFADKFSLQGVMDRHYYNSLWASLLKLPSHDRKATERILSDEISLKNCSLALRLRGYYSMPPGKVKSYLIDISVDSQVKISYRGKKDQKKKSGTLADDALKCLEYPLDNLSAWSSWRWKEFLNSSPMSSNSNSANSNLSTFSFGERDWRLDPKHFQNAASRYLYHLARHFFHLNPFSLDTIFCFIKLKQFEEDLLTSGAEGLSIGMPVKDILSMLGVEH